MKLIHRFTGVCLASGLALTLASCGGGGSALSSMMATLSGVAIDAPIPGAQITITSGAPLNDPGAQTIGTITANGTGQFSISINLPSTSTPIFANAADPINTAVVLSSYLGSSSVLATKGTLTTSNLPDLDITPVTTAALAVYAQVNGSSYGALTPAAYATTLQQYNGDILAIAAAIKAVGDNLCTPAISVSSTTNLAALIAAQSSLTSSNSTTLQTAATTLGGNCPAVMASLPQQIAADPHFGPELDMGDVIDAGVLSVPAGTYALQGIIAETGMTPTQTTTTATPNPLAMFSDAAVTIASNGQITSTDNNISGTVVGNLVTLTLTNGTQQYTLRGKVGAVQTALVSGGQAYAIQSGGTNNASNLLTNFNAVLITTGETPVWNGIAAPTTATSNDGITCASGAFPVRLDAFGSAIGGGSVGECVTPSATGWAMASSGTSGADFNFDDNASASSTMSPPSLSAPNWTAASSSTPFILSSAGASFTRNGVTTSGTTYYVMGTRSVVFASTQGNSLLRMHDTVFAQLAEAGHSSDGGNGATNGGTGSMEGQDH